MPCVSLSSKVPECNHGLMTVDWFMPDGTTRNVVRHPINDRKQVSLKQRYKKGILTHGILEGCRGEAWLVQLPGCILHAASAVY